MSGGNNSPSVLNGGSNDYDRTIAFDAPVAYDTGLFVDPNEQNLGQLRKRLLIRLGYAAQANNPPPGMAALLNDFLQSAQTLLYWRYKVLRNERWWTWSTVAGQNLYDVPIDGLNFMEFRRITWSGIQIDTQWYPIWEGIDPVLYSGDQTSRPIRFELRQYLEVWPTPDDVYLIRLKAHLGLMVFAADTDYCTVNSELVFLTALANAKAHYGQPDANNIAAQASTMLRNLVAASHGTTRYIPKADNWSPPSRPILLDPS